MLPHSQVLPMVEPTSSAAYVDQHAARFIEELRTACRIASVSVEAGPALIEMANTVQARLEGILDTVELLENIDGYPPAVWGELRGTNPNAPRLLLYSHYDVQPPDPLDLWETEPFDAAIVDGSIVARGVADDKADVFARIHALEAWQATRGRPEFTVIWLCEGAEEIGSKGLGEIASRNRDRLDADACLWESYLRREDGTPEIGYGCRGMLYVELTLDALASDQHSSFRSVLRSAPAELARAIASLTDPTGLVTIDGFHDFVIEPTASMLAALADGSPPTGIPGVRGRSPFVVDDPVELTRRLYFEPTANVAGLFSGYTGPGSKTVLPARASAKMDFRLVPDQDPDDIAAKLRRHLDTHGFEAVEIKVLSAVRPAFSSLDEPLGRLVRAAAHDTMGNPVDIPLVAGTGPVATLKDVLQIPVIMPPGSIRFDSGIHAPNERCRLSDYLDTVRFNVRLLELLADDSSGLH
jgi:acetylornithine deacetylase/succinyl-diaminopimelate desuccinylase-like protein